MEERNDHRTGHEAASRAGRLPVKPLVVFGALVVALLVVYFSPLRGYLGQVREIKGRLQGMGFAGPLIYMLCVFPLIAMGFPRLLFCPIGGMAFGFVHGLLWTQLPTLAGYYVIFLFVRWGGRDFVLRHWPKLARVKRIPRRHAVPAIILIRQMPISGLVINFLLGLSPVRHIDFILGTAVGLLPEAIPFTLVGSSAGKFDPHVGALYVVAAVAVLVIVWVGLWFVARRSKIFAGLRENLEEGGDGPPAGSAT